MTVSEKSQAILFICYSASLTEEEDELMKCVGGDIQNTDLQCHSDKVKGCSKHGCPCTARLDGLNRDSFDKTKESGETWCFYKLHFGFRST